jgi:hypothetical protein
LKLNSSIPYIEELTVFIIVRIEILNAFSISMPFMVSRLDRNNKEIINIIIVKKYLLISTSSKLIFVNRSLFM